MKRFFNRIAQFVKEFFILRAGIFCDVIFARVYMYLPCTSGLISMVSGSTRAILLTLHVNVAPNSFRVICISSKLLPVPNPVSVMVDELVAEMEQYIS